MKRGASVPLPAQVAARTKADYVPTEQKQYDGNTEVMISTGSTLLDLAISGSRVRGGGLPAGILVEIFGPAGCGKTVLLCEIAGNVQRANGEILFCDPEARLNAQFASMFGLTVDENNYSRPNTVPEVFAPIRDWQPADTTIINGIFADSLAALSTDMELDPKTGDKMGMRRAKEFSEQTRKTCRILPEKNFLMVCSNQVRVNPDAGAYGQKYVTPGGEAIGFYASVRLRAYSPKKIYREVTVNKKEYKRAIGVETEFEVYKNSVGAPYRTAPVTIVFDYGIDDVRANLQYVKQLTKNTVYAVGEYKAGRSLEEAIQFVEQNNLEVELREQVIDLWEDLESKFQTDRQPKRRF